MPISREKMAAYPGGSIRSPEWLSIRQRILERASYRCEGTSQFPDCPAEQYLPHPITGARVVLTIAHMNRDVTDNRDENLRALCQRCHNNWDRLARRENHLKRIYSNQLPLNLRQE